MYRQFTPTKMAAALAVLLSTITPAAEVEHRPFLLTGPAAVQTLAELRFSNGNVVQFVLTPETGEVVYIETTAAGPNESFFFTEEDNTPLERFLALTADYVPVPRALIEASREDDANSGDGTDANPAANSDRQPAAWEEHLARRHQVDQVSAPVFVEIGKIGKSPQRSAAGQGSCQSGSAGADYFEDHHCGTLGPYGYGEGEGDCDKGLYSWIQRTSSEPMRHTWTKMAACGVGGKVIHSRNSAGGFTTVFTGISPADTVTGFWSKRSGIAWKRRARFERQGSSGGVRGWTHFFKQITE